MKMKLLFSVLFFLILGKQSSVYAQTDAFSENFGSLPVSETRISPVSKDKERYGTFNTFLVGPRINYIQGKYGFLGCSGAFMWHDINYIMESHLGFSAGMDFRLTKSTVYVPKVALEYRYFIFVARVGYTYFTDFRTDFEHRISAEIGLSLFGFLDVTYLHSFGSERNPFHLENDHLTITATIPLNF